MCGAVHYRDIKVKGQHQHVGEPKRIQREETMNSESCDMSYMFVCAHWGVNIVQPRQSRIA
jgi:hypothetical protein